jgi:poly(A) polymerase
VPSIPKEHIDPDADKILRRLVRRGHTAYLVGGCVRDLLLGRTPKDFDVATSATPNEIKDLFRNCRIIGRRFRLAHIFFGQKIIETSTFRTNPREGATGEEEELLIKRDNVFGTAEEDARRRDFTINGLFYDIEKDEVIDYVLGLPDLEARMVRTIGDPDIRFREDPVRILRAIKFAARLSFHVEPATYAAMLTHRGEIPKCAPPRVLEEIYRLLRGGAAKRSMELLLETGVCATLAPELAYMYAGTVIEGVKHAPELPEGEALLDARARAWRLLDEVDAEQAPTNALLLCTLVAPFLPDTPEDQGNAADLAIEGILHPLVQRLRVSRRDAERARQILLAQKRLSPSRKKKARPAMLVKRDYFGEALRLYEMIGATTGNVGDEIHYWRTLAKREGTATPHAPEQRGEPQADPGDGSTEPALAAGEIRRRRRRRRGGRRRRKPGAVPGDVAASQPATPPRESSE